MQELRKVAQRDKLLLESDVSGAMQSLSRLPTASEEWLGQSCLLTQSGYTSTLVDGSVVETFQVYAGKKYACKMYYYTLPSTATKVRTYRWVEIDENETGKLGNFKTALSIVEANNAEGQTTVCLRWDEPADITDVDSKSDQAIWGHSVIVRKEVVVEHVSAGTFVDSKTYYRWTYTSDGARAFVFMTAGIDYTVGESIPQHKLFASNKAIEGVVYYDASGNQVSVTVNQSDVSDLVCKVQSDLTYYRKEGDTYYSVTPGSAYLGAVGTVITAAQKAYLALTMSNIYTATLTPPANIHDGTIVGYSNIRSQYKKGSGFIDTHPSYTLYEYNVFAITRGGVATPAVTEASTDDSWAQIYEHTIEGTLGEIMTIGDTVVMHHNIFGDLEMQLVAVDAVKAAADITAHTATFMTRYTLPKVSYDVPELTEAGGYVNPGDKVTDTESKVSKLGRGDWLKSNLRQWLNANPAYVLSTDTVYDTKKFYFIRTVTSGVVSYTVVDEPRAPETINPSELGYYECPTVLTAQDSWDKVPNAYTGEEEETAAMGFVWNGKELPGFLAGLDSTMLNYIATSKVTTITDPYFYTHTGLAPEKKVITNDRVFIPSHREVFGTEPYGCQALNVAEGTWFSYFNPDVDLGDISRSVLKRDFDTSYVSGYFLRTIGTAQNSTTGGWGIQDAAHLWTVDRGDYDTLPELGSEDVTATHTAKVTKNEVSQIGTPGIAVCITIGKVST